MRFNIRPLKPTGAVGASDMYKFDQDGNDNRFGERESILAFPGNGGGGYERPRIFSITKSTGLSRSAGHTRISDNTATLRPLYLFIFSRPLRPPLVTSRVHVHVDAIQWMPRDTGPSATRGE